MPSRTRARAAVVDHQHRELIFASCQGVDRHPLLLAAAPRVPGVPRAAEHVHRAPRGDERRLQGRRQSAAPRRRLLARRFLEALRLVADHRRPLSWMLLTPALPVVYGEAYGDLVAAAYHLLQAHLTRVQKLRLSNLLRRAARQCIGPEHCEARCSLRTSPSASACSRSARSTSPSSTTPRAAHHRRHRPLRRRRRAPPLVAAIHYTLAGFYTCATPCVPDAPSTRLPVPHTLALAPTRRILVHIRTCAHASSHPLLLPIRRRYHSPEVGGLQREDGPQGHTLERANGHLNKASWSQSQQLGALHISTLCSHLVKAQVRGSRETTHRPSHVVPTPFSHMCVQVLLMRDNEDTSGQECKALLHDQLRLCESSLGANHPRRQDARRPRAPLHADGR